MKWIVIRFGILILLTLCLFACASADKFKEGDWEYELITLDGTTAAKITDYNPVGNPPQTLIVPEKLGGHPVSQIEVGSFSNYRHDENWNTYKIISPKVLVLPAGILAVDSDAIRFSGLEEIRIENGINYDTVDGVLFERMTGTLIAYPYGKKDKTYVIPEGTRIVGSEAFNGDVNYLEEVRVPETVHIFRKGAFSKYELNLNIPESMETIEERAICYTTQITSASPRFQVADDCLIDVETKTLLTMFDRYDGKNVRTYIIPEGVERIGEGALNLFICNRLIFPSTLKAIGKFNSIIDHKSDNLIFPAGLETIGDYFSVYGVKKLVFPSSLRSIGSMCFCNSSDLETVEFYEGIESIGWDSFTGNKNLKSVILPESLREMPDYKYDFLFSDCPNLMVTVLPDSQAEYYCRKIGIPFRYPGFGLWQVDSKEAEEILSLSGAENVRIRLDKDTLELLYFLAGTAETKEIFRINWQGQRLEMSGGYMEYLLVKTYNDNGDLTGEQLILKTVDAEMHLTRIEEEQ